MTALYFSELYNKIPFKYKVAVKREYKESLKKIYIVSGLTEAITNYGDKVGAYDGELSSI